MPQEKKKYFAPLSSSSSLGISIVVFTINADLLKKHIEEKKKKPTSEASEKQWLIRKMKEYLEERGAIVHRVNDALYAQGFFTSDDRWNQLRVRAASRCMNLETHSGTSLPDPKEPAPLPQEPAVPKPTRGRPRGRTGKVGPQQP